MKKIQNILLFNMIAMSVLMGVNHKDTISFNHHIAKEKTSKANYAGWYLRTVVEAETADGIRYKHSSAGIFGKLKESHDGKDRHDIRAYGSAIFQVVFPQAEWGEQSGEYFSNYVHYNHKRSHDKTTWTFQVRNKHSVNLSNAKLKIMLDGAYNVYYTQKGALYESKHINTKINSHITLVDVDNQTVYSYDELKNLDLSMDGLHTRTFKWVYGEFEHKDLPIQAKARSKRDKEKHFTVMPQKAKVNEHASKFGFPPQ